MVSIGLNILSAAVVTWKEASEIYLANKKKTSKAVNRHEETQLLEYMTEIEDYLETKAKFPSPPSLMLARVLKAKSDRLETCRKRLPMVKAELDDLEKRLDVKRAAEAKTLEDAEIEITTLLAGLNQNLYQTEVEVLQNLQAIDLSPNGAAPKAVEFKRYIEDWRFLIRRRQEDARDRQNYRRLERRPPPRLDPPGLAAKLNSLDIIHIL